MEPIEVTVYETYEPSRNNPDAGPGKPPEKGMWVWWRSGPHPQGVLQAMDVGQGWVAAYQANREEFPVFQDFAWGDSGDFGNYTCHACGYCGDGYPEPGHMTECDGECKRKRCSKHRPKLSPSDFVVRVTTEPNGAGSSPTVTLGGAGGRRLTREEIDAALQGLEQARDELDSEAQ